MSGTLTKQDVARSQLLTALHLFFDDGDPVSVYTLASNAWEIIDSLCDSNEIGSVSNETRGHISIDKDLKKDFINGPSRNFFKHADRDPEHVLVGFTEHDCDAVLFLAAEDYIRLYDKSPVEFQIYPLWYLAGNISRVTPAALARIEEGAQKILPGIQNMNREQEKEVWFVAVKLAKSDPDVINDPRTEPSTQIHTTGTLRAGI